MRSLPGTIHAQRVRCGKENCRCARGSPHVAYYRFWRERGRQRKAYVRKADLEAMRQACAERREIHTAAVEMKKLAGRHSLLDRMLAKMDKWWA
jgi:hypothetical protein